MIRNIIKKYNMLWLAIVLLVASFIYICTVGDTFNLTLRYYDSEQVFPEGEPEGGRFDMKDITRVASDSKGRVDILEAYLEDHVIHIKVKGRTPGRVFLEYGQTFNALEVLYVHGTGVVTVEDYFGPCTGSRTVWAVWFLYIILLIYRLIKSYRRSLHENMYQYKNILLLGVIIFVCMVTVFMSFVLTSDSGIINGLYIIMGTLQSIGIYTFPVVMIAFIMATVSNLKLIRREGRTWRNFLGFILGLFMIVASVLPLIISEYLQRSTAIDVHNWKGTGRFVEMFVTNTCGILNDYFECILIATIVIGIKAAKHVPKFDKDYIIIHGCQIRKDGSLTKLLQSRTDRAIEFAEMQKEATGRDIIFVPSGGQGSDEVISEAEAIKRYLLDQGIPEERILPEDKSRNTEENLINAAALVRERSGEASKIAFSTTNYHAFRAGLLATSNGIKAEGVGSGTKSYFWLNAFIREFAATIVSERKTHAAVIGTMTILNIIMVVLTYVSNVILS